MHTKNQTEIIDLLIELPTVELSTNWEFVITLQILNIRNGINGVSIPDLMIIDNVIGDGPILYSEDTHFSLVCKHFHFDLFRMN